MQSHQFCQVSASCGSASSHIWYLSFLLSNKVTQSKWLLPGNGTREDTEHLAVPWAPRCLCVIWDLISLARALKGVLLALKKQSSPVFSRLNSSLSFATFLHSWLARAELTLSLCRDWKTGQAQDTGFPSKQTCPLRNCCNKGRSHRRRCSHAKNYRRWRDAERGRANNKMRALRLALTMLIMPPPSIRVLHT